MSSLSCVHPPIHLAAPHTKVQALFNVQLSRLTWLLPLPFLSTSLLPQGHCISVPLLGSDFHLLLFPLDPLSYSRHQERCSKQPVTSRPCLWFGSRHCVQQLSSLKDLCPWKKGWVELLAQREQSSPFSFADLSRAWPSPGLFELSVRDAAWQRWQCGQHAATVLPQSAFLSVEVTSAPGSWSQMLLVPRPWKELQ